MAACAANRRRPLSSVTSSTPTSSSSPKACLPLLSLQSEQIPTDVSGRRCRLDGIWQVKCAQFRMTDILQSQSTVFTKTRQSLQPEPILPSKALRLQVSLLSRLDNNQLLILKQACARASAPPVRFFHFLLLRLPT